jgi:anti-sigma factor RsiW
MPDRPRSLKTSDSPVAAVAAVVAAEAAGAAVAAEAEVAVVAAEAAAAGAEASSLEAALAAEAAVDHPAGYGHQGAGSTAVGLGLPLRMMHLLLSRLSNPPR